MDSSFVCYIIQHSLYGTLLLLHLPLSIPTSQMIFCKAVKSLHTESSGSKRYTTVNQLTMSSDAYLLVFVYKNKS